MKIEVKDVVKQNEKDEEAESEANSQGNGGKSAAPSIKFEQLLSLPLLEQAAANLQISTQ